jgi:hypothetical protein
VRNRKALILGLVVVLALAVVAVVACGGSDEEAKANLSAALDTAEASMAGFASSIGADSSVDDITAALESFEPEWQAVIDAAKEVDGADAAAAEQAWTDVTTAIDSIPENATILEAAAIIMGPVTNLQTVAADLRSVVPKEE